MQTFSVGLTAYASKKMLDSFSLPLTTVNDTRSAFLQQ